MILLEIWAIFIMVSCLWFMLLLGWIDRNPKYAEQIKNKEAPYPWFFYVFAFFILGVGILSIGLVFYYIFRLIYILIGGF